MYVKGFGGDIPDCAKPCMPSYCTPAPFCVGRLPGDTVKVGKDVYRCVQIDYERCAGLIQDCAVEACGPDVEIVLREGDLAAVYMGSERETPPPPKPPGKTPTPPKSPHTKKDGGGTGGIIATIIVAAVIIFVAMFFLGRRRVLVSPLTGEVKGKVRID